MRSKLIIIVILFISAPVFGTWVVTNKNIPEEVGKYFDKLDSSSIPQLLEIVENGVPPAKIKAIKQLGTLKARESMEILVNIISFIWDINRSIKNKQDYNEDVRAAAALTLGEIGDLTVLHTIGKTLISDKDNKVRQNCARSLGMLRHRDGIKYLKEAIKYQLTLNKELVDSRLVKECARSLGMIGRQDGFFILVEITLSDKLQYFTRKEALKSLELIKWGTANE